METPNQPLTSLRICDLTGQLAGAGATRFLAAFGAQVIRIEDPVRQGEWDIVRGSPPYKDDHRGINRGGAFNNHNVEKFGITADLRTERGRDLFRRLVQVSDVVTENFAAGVLASLGFTYEDLCGIKADIIYVSSCGFGQSGPYANYKAWGPVVQACCGLTYLSTLPQQPPAGWGFSYMDHHAGNFMAIAVLAAVLHHQRTGEGQWVDLATTEAGATLLGPCLLDASVNGRKLRGEETRNSNRSQHPAMSPHGIYPANGFDNWIAIACRDEDDWRAFQEIVGEPWCTQPAFATMSDRKSNEDELDRYVGDWTSRFDKSDLVRRLVRGGIPAAPVNQPSERIDHDGNTAQWGLWPTVVHTEIGEVRVDGLPVHLSETDWNIQRGAPCLGEHNDYVYREILGLSMSEIESLREDGII